VPDALAVGERVIDDHGAVVAGDRHARRRGLGVRRLPIARHAQIDRRARVLLDALDERDGIHRQRRSVGAEKEKQAHERGRL
jgi:hypothetical protein